MYDLALKNNKFLHIAPRDLKKKHIDPKLRDIVERINKTDYCWTVFSCQGHLSGSQKGTLPYLVLLCANDKRPHIFETLFKCFEYDLAYENEFPLLGSRSDIIKVSLGIKDENFTYITIHFVAMNKKDQEFSVKIMDIFSRTI
jgi:hypothetical protein